MSTVHAGRDGKRESASALFQSLEEYSVASGDPSLLNFDLSHERFQGALLPEAEMQRLATHFGEISGEDYQNLVITPAESNGRLSVIKLVAEFSERVIQEWKGGPIYIAEVDIKIGSNVQRIGILAQNRDVNNGVWSPEHHLQAAKWVRQFEERQIPIVTFIDTPGADAGSEANRHNQAHSISALIAIMADLKVPSVGIVWGLGFSGGAMPLATTNVLLSVKDGIFSTIQPKGLASIARKQQLDWQTCARLVGVSAPELYQEGVLHGVIDYSPLEGTKNSRRIKLAILGALADIDHRSQQFTQIIKPLSGHYQDSSLALSDDVDSSPLATSSVRTYASIFGFACRYLRTLTLRARLNTQSVKLENADQIALGAIISPDEQQRQISDRRFGEWLKRTDRLIYEDNLYKSWARYQASEDRRSDERGYIASLFLGDPKGNFQKSLYEFSAEIAFYLYNGWQHEAQHHLGALHSELQTLDEPHNCRLVADDQLSFLDVIRDERFRSVAIEHCIQLDRFDRLYECILANLTVIVAEFADKTQVSKTLMFSLLEQIGVDDDDAMSSFGAWLMRMSKASNFGPFLRTAEQWKKVQHPRLSEVVLVVASYFFENLYPELFESLKENKSFSGQFVPASIGRRKDFWNRLNLAIKDIRIQAILNDIKPGKRFTPQALIETIFTNFVERDAEVTTANPKKFPGFSESILRQQSDAKSTSGLITGLADFVLNGESEQVGLFVSNHTFQAGAFDMSSAERLCRLLDYCGQHAIPVVGFVSSGGMQTKEGASALFSMAVVNDQINRFVIDLGLPLLMFGYGDCTGGAQASLVTHPLVDSYYFSGTNMPFAGRIVVPEYLPVTATLSNYLYLNHDMAGTDSMQGLVKHPMIENLDSRLKEADAMMISAQSSVFEVISHWLKQTHLPLNLGAANALTYVKKFEPYQRVLIHARGCTAVKLIREAHEMGLNVVLVQSDPDMNSVSADMLKDGDSLVCLGGYTSDESYLNGESVLRIAELNNAQALHPGIGFLSENSQFAHQCMAQGLNFVGPSPESMEAMGDKSRAIHTSLELGVQVVPGSHGLLRNFEHAEQVATEIGMPIILKAAHGGGGKGIVVVENQEDFEESFHMIKAEARSSFGSGDIYLERFVTRFRHIEVQLLRDSFGCAKVLGLRDCSVQRNKQKIIEESISNALPDVQKQLAKDYTLKLAEACDYHGAGTVEFIYDLDKDSLYFMEMNTRLQVEHPVTEMVSGIDIVKAQFRISMGESIEHLAGADEGHAIEVRINAESVTLVHEAVGHVTLGKKKLNVQPMPGVVSKCLFPVVDGIKHIVTVDDGKTIPPYYDNLVAQVITHSDTRDAAITKMLEYLETVVIEGVATNIPLLKVILKDEVFLSEQYDTGYLLDLVDRNPQELQVLEAAAIDDASTKNETSEISISGSTALKVLAPSTSIMYCSPSPDQPVYVNEGDIVTVDQTLCLLEAMKMFQTLSLADFNKADKEIYPAEQKYTISHIKGVSDQQVNAGDLLFVIEPVEG